MKITSHDEFVEIRLQKPQAKVTAEPQKAQKQRRKSRQRFVPNKRRESGLTPMVQDMHLRKVDLELKQLPSLISFSGKPIFPSDPPFLEALPSRQHVSMTSPPPLEKDPNDV